MVSAEVGAILMVGFVVVAGAGVAGFVEAPSAGSGVNVWGVRTLPVDVDGEPGADGHYLLVEGGPVRAEVVTEMGSVELVLERGSAVWLPCSEDGVRVDVGGVVVYEEQRLPCGPAPGDGGGEAGPEGRTADGEEGGEGCIIQVGVVVDGGSGSVWVEGPGGEMVLVCLGGAVDRVAS